MRRPSLHAHAARVARRIGVQVGLGISGLVFVGLALSLASHYRFSVGRAVASHVKSFSFWMQVNDIFQIQRSLADLVEAEGLKAALVTDARGLVVASKAEDALVPALLNPRSAFASTTGLVLRREFPLHEAGLVANYEGKIIFAVEIPYLFFVAWLVFSLLITRAAIALARRNIAAVATSLTAPVNRLAAAVEGATSLVDLDGVEGEFAEIEFLRRTMSDTGARLLQQEKELQTAERAKEMFELGRQLAHDIRSPLSALRLAVQGNKPFDDDRRSLVINASNRIEKIAEDLLTRQRQATPVGFALATACEEIVREKRPALEERAIDLTLDLGGVDSAALVRGEKNDFQRVLSNLINNAVDAGGGRVRLVLDRQTRASLVIEDDGAGVSAELLRDLNEGRARSTKASGNGLGTAHARQTLRGWGGDLRYRSELGRGTTAEVQLPWV